MDDIVTSYLAQNGHIDLPGLGEFLVRKKSGRLEFHEKKMKAPYQKIYFDKKDVQFEKQFVDYVCRMMDIDKEESTRRLKTWIQNIKEVMVEKGTVKLPFGGRLSNLDGSDPEYTIDADIFRMGEVSAIRIIRNKQLQDEEKAASGGDDAQGVMAFAASEVPAANRPGRRWKTAALIIFILSAILILVSIFTNNLVPKINAPEAPATYTK